MFSFVTANPLSLELKQDAEHMSQVDILFWSIIQDKTGVWSPADQGLQDTITEIGPSLAEVNTKGPLNSWSDKMRVQVVLMGV